jgi:hypothetical protein
VRKKLTVRLDENQYETLKELKDEKMPHLSLNDIIITAIKELSKKEFRK